jgi:hypothetical protein
MNYIEDVLPELGEIIAKDFISPQTELLEVFEGYVLLFDVMYKALSLPEEGQKEVKEAIEEFIELRQNGEWNSPNELVFKIRDIVQRYEKMKELTMRLAEQMLENLSQSTHTLFSFYREFLDYSYVMGCVAKIFSNKDEETISETFKVLEEFLQGRKILWELKRELENIVSKFNKEVSHGKKKA